MKLASNMIPIYSSGKYLQVQVSAPLWSALKDLDVYMGMYINIYRERKSPREKDTETERYRKKEKGGRKNTLKAGHVCIHTYI